MNQLSIPRTDAAGRIVTDTYAPRVPMHVARDRANDEADAAQDAMDAAHAWDLELALTHSCKCGHTFKTANGLGLHRGAVARSSSKLWDDTYLAALDRAGY